jgi:hypothetical protein
MKLRPLVVMAFAVFRRKLSIPARKIVPALAGTESVTNLPSHMQRVPQIAQETQLDAVMQSAMDRMKPRQRVPPIALHQTTNRRFCVN